MLRACHLVYQRLEYRLGTKMFGKVATQLQHCGLDTAVKGTLKDLRAECDEKVKSMVEKTCVRDENGNEANYDCTRAKDVSRGQSAVIFATLCTALSSLMPFDALHPCIAQGVDRDPLDAGQFRRRSCKQHCAEGPSLPPPIH